MEKKPILPLKVKKWLPVAGLVLLTFALIMFFKKKNLEEIVNEQGKSIVEFYTQNLEPLFSRASLTKEDVYDFAFNNQLPLDKSNGQYFKLNDLSDGNNYFEFRKASQDDLQKTDLAGFEKNLGLNKGQSSRVDSILESYKEELKRQIFVNDKNTIAINYNLWDLNKAIKADVLRYLSQENLEKLDKLTSAYSSLYNNQAVDKMINEVRTDKRDRFIFVTPDTIFSHNFRFNEEKLRRQAREFEKNAKEFEKNVKLKIAFNNGLKKASKGWNKKDFKLEVDSDFCRIEIPPIEIPEIDLSDLKVDLADLNDELKTFTVRANTSNDRKAKRKIAGHSSVIPSINPQTYELDIALPNVGEIINQSLGAVKVALSSSGLSGEFADSLAEMINASVEASMNDSMSDSDRKELKREMEKLKKELKQLKYQKENTK